jgi:hypothetical protein
MMVAAGVVHLVVGADVVLNVAGAAPKVQAIMAPVTTSCAIRLAILSIFNWISTEISRAKITVIKREQDADRLLPPAAIQPMPQPGPVIQERRRIRKVFLFAGCRACKAL